MPLCEGMGQGMGQGIGRLWCVAAPLQLKHLSARLARATRTSYGQYTIISHTVISKNRLSLSVVLEHRLILGHRITNHKRCLDIAVCDISMTMAGRRYYVNATCSTAAVLFYT